MPSTACEKASIAVLTADMVGRSFMYLPSRKATRGNIAGLVMLVFVSLKSLVRMAYGVTSLPVPAVVGTCAMGSAFASYPPAKISSSLRSCTQSVAIAFAASMGDPPPTATIKSAPALTSSATPSRTQAIVGLGVTRSNTVAR